MRQIKAEILLLILATTAAMTQLSDAVASDSKITMVDEGMVAPDGLWLTRKAFANTITPKGDCMKIHKGYIYVTRYQGGMDNRSVWLSRKKIGGKEWRHIKFDHRHVMFRKDKHLPEEEQRGDAHNSIAIGICPKDDTIHLLYDMHAYTPKDFPEDFFNYSYSREGAAVVPDEEWTENLFFPKQNYLNKDVAARKPTAYHRVTYPEFILTPNGDLLAKWRVGGHTSAWMHFSLYDGKKWSDPWKWNDQPCEKVTGFYGDFSIMNGCIYAVWCRRTISDSEIGYRNGNRGTYIAYCEDPSGRGDWTTLDGSKTFPLPLRDLEPFKVMDTQDRASFVVTPSGAQHLLGTDKEGTSRHYFQKKDEDQRSEISSVGGGIPIAGRLYQIGLENGRVIIRSAEEGTNDYRVDYQQKSGRAYNHGVVQQHGNSLFYYLMQKKPVSHDARPIYVLRFDIGSN
ncbi:MAG: BNR-4 repeat-containing protein [Victivallales bacterium]|nr:BNR-4 repeat-containing protein [Victivallales bacterium]